MQVNFPISSNLVKLSEALLKEGDEIRIIGGAVRNFLLKLPLSDIDIACKYQPEETLKILQSNNIKAIPTGIKYGTITAVINGQPFEITSLRADIENYGRHCQVDFIEDYKEDAKRRDFTINAMSIDFKGNLYDYFNGIKDLKDGLIRFIGDPSQRVSEDYLRILRLFRFYCFYGKKIDPASLGAALKDSSFLATISKERIRQELLKILQYQQLSRIVECLKIMQQVNEVVFFDQFSLEKLEDFSQFYQKNQKNLPFVTNYLMILAILIEKNSNLLKILTKNLVLTKKEQKYLKNYLKYRNLTIKSDKIDIFEAILDNDKLQVIEFLTINQAIDRNYNDFSVKINNLNKLTLPAFPIKGQDLINEGFSSSKIGIELKRRRKIWLESEVGNITL